MSGESGASAPPQRPVLKSPLIRTVKLEITPQPDEAEREAIRAAFADDPEPPLPYDSAWRRAGLEETLEA